MRRLLLIAGLLAAAPAFAVGVVAPFPRLAQPGGNAPDAANNAKLLRLLADVPVERRTARFRCALAFTVVTPHPSTTGFQGCCEGRIGYLPRGAHGFGYDPLFRPQDQDATFAELGDDVKNRISHRARALAALAQIPRMFSGRIATVPGVTMSSAVDIRVTSRQPVLYHVDGEPYIGAAVVAARPWPAALRVVVG